MISPEKPVRSRLAVLRLHLPDGSMAKRCLVTLFADGTAAVSPLVRETPATEWLRGDYSLPPSTILLSEPRLTP